MRGKIYKDVMQKCEACGKEFMLRYRLDGTYEYIGEPCDCEAGFHPVGGELSIHEWVDTLYRMDKMVERLEELEWAVHVDETGWELSQYSPAGEDFSVYIHCDPRDLHDLHRKCAEYVRDFEPEEHAVMWYGTNGAPCMATLLEDAQEIKKMLEELEETIRDFLFGPQVTIAESVKSQFALRPLLEEAMKDVPMSHRMHPNIWEKMVATLGDYHGSKGSVMDFTADDWKAWQKYQGHPFDPAETVDDVCVICDELMMRPRFDLEDCLAEACQAWHDGMTAYPASIAEQEVGFPPMEYIQDCVTNIYKWRTELLPKAIEAIMEEMEANKQEEAETHTATTVVSPCNFIDDMVKMVMWDTDEQEE